MLEYELKNIDPEDIEDLLLKVENSFDIRFVNNELANIENFGNLCDHIANKIQLDNSDDCTSQQAFYKLRDAISSTLKIGKKTITPDLLLKDFLPRQSRRLNIKKLESKLGFELNILRPPHWVTGALGFLLLISLAAFFVNWQIAITGLVFSIAGLWFTNKIENELNLHTVRQLVEKITRENYLKSRRNPQSFNKREIEQCIEGLVQYRIGYKQRQTYKRDQICLKS